MLTEGKGLKSEWCFSLKLFARGSVSPEGGIFSSFEHRLGWAQSAQSSFQALGVRGAL